MTLRVVVPESVGDARRYVQGRGTYVADYASHVGCSALYVVRAEMAHARILAINVQAVRNLDGVLGAFTAADIVEDLGAVPVIEPRISASPELEPYLQPVLATDRVRYVGDPIAIIVARDRYLAEDAASLIEIEFEPLPAVVDIATSKDATALFEDHPNLIATLHAGFGDVDAAFKGADIVVDLDIEVGRHSGIPMETRGLVAQPLSSGVLEVYGAAKVVHSNRRTLATMLGVDPALLRLRELDVGGGFGIRGEFYPEDFLVPWAARRLGVGVSWVEDRREHLVAANHSREQVHAASIAARRDGRFLAVRTECFVDSGAYVRTVGLRVGDLTLGEIPGPYRFEAYSGTAHCVVSNKTPTGTYRSPGRFESSFVRERLIEALAGRLGMSSQELRHRNLVSPGDMPYQTGLRSAGKAVAFRTGDYPELYGRIVDRTEALAAERAERYRSERPGGGKIGWATACFIEKSGLGPFEDARVAVRPDGRVHVTTGASYLGQGLQRALANVVAERLTVPVDVVCIDRVDTDMLDDGVGTYASRSLVMSGGAVAIACDRLLVLGREVAGRRLQADPSSVRVEAGGLHASGSTVSWEDVAKEGLEATARFEKDAVTYGFGAHGAVVAVDPRTGMVRVLDLVLGYDVGNAIDEDVVISQLQGAAMQALGGALIEKFGYDGEGNPTSTTFMDYLMPTAGEAPRMHVVLAHSVPDDNPLGARGAGEAGVPAVAAAIVRAVESALGAEPALLATPIRPQDVLSLFDA